MKVKVHEIPEEGFTLSERLDPAGMGLQIPGALRFTAPVEVKASFQRERDTVWVQVSAEGNRELVCGRCLEAVAAPYEGRFDFDYPVKNQTVLDITDDVRQEILLNAPVKFLCREDCKGLCPQCGGNWNKGSCSCRR